MLDGKLQRVRGVTLVAGQKGLMIELDTRCRRYEAVM